MKPEYPKIKQIILEILRSNPNEYYYPSDLNRLTGISVYLIKRIASELNEHQIMCYTDEKLIFVNKGDIDKQIPQSYLDIFLSNGWNIGRSEKVKRNAIIRNGGDPDAVKTCWMHKADEEIEIPLAEKSKYLDLGYYSGKIRRGTTTGKIAIHMNGRDKYIRPEEVNEYIKEGWELGGQPKQNLRDYSNVWNKGLTKETDSRIAEKAKRAEGKKLSEVTKLKISNKIKEFWLDPEYRSIHCFKNTVPWNKGRHDLPSPSEESREKKRLSTEKNMIDKYGSLEEYYAFRVECRDKRIATDPEYYVKIDAKRKETLIKKYGSLEAYYAYKSQILYETKTKNNSFNTSVPEELYYSQLCEIYGFENVVRQYKDDRYPFNCDFYIKSEDLFIEYNGHWTHGIEPYDPNNEYHLKIIEKYKSRESKFYKTAIYVWTDLDVRKLECAKKNNLNYRRIYFDGTEYIY